MRSQRIWELAPGPVKNHYTGFGSAQTQHQQLTPVHPGTCSALFFFGFSEPLQFPWMAGIPSVNWLVPSSLCTADTT